MIIDLVRIRQGREKLALLAQKHPELRGARSAANVENWIETLESIGEKPVEYEKKCKYILCGKTFMAARKDKEFCCDAHRTAAGKMRDTREPSDLAKLMTRAIEFDSQYYGAPSNREIKRARDAALRDVLSAIEAELGIVHELSTDEPEGEQDEPEDELDVMLSELGLEPQFVRGKLRAFMVETGFSQGKIAKLAGVSQSRISTFLSNDDEKKTDGSEDFRRAILDVVTQHHGMDRR